MWVPIWKLNVQAQRHPNFDEIPSGRLEILFSVAYIVNKSRAITLHLLGTDKYETSGAHLNMLVLTFL